MKSTDLRPDLPELVLSLERPGIERAKGLFGGRCFPSRSSLRTLLVELCSRGAFHSLGDAHARNLRA